MRLCYVISLDPAQLVDYAALSVIEVVREDGKPRNTYRLRSLNRKQHEAYPVILDWTKQTFLKPEFRKDVEFQPVLVIDRGGPGIGLQDDLDLVKIKSTGITLTGGRNWSHDERRRNLTVSKSLMIDRFLGLWDKGSVQVSTKASFYGMFRGELKDFRGGLNKLRNDTSYEGAIGKHDDLIMSVAQAVWLAEMFIRPRRRFRVPEVASFHIDPGNPWDPPAQESFFRVAEWDRKAAMEREGRERASR